jgi:putative ubiquitin-RnfH superfamily antitoxin RatB of RatAB toxin-antitoxin module
VIQVQWLELKTKDPGVLTTLPEVLQLPPQSTVKQALLAIGLDPARVQQLLEQRAVAVFGLYATDKTVLFDGDRVEILDGLKFDPMDSRRRRAQHKVLTKRQKELARYERRSRKQGKTPL